MFLKLLPFLCMVCAVVCDYELRVRVHSYLNADSRCAACARSFVNPIYSCCDNRTNTGVCSGDELCDTFFQYCLRPLGATGIRCPLNVTAVNTIQFSPNTDILLDIGDTVLGRENPFLYFGVTWRGFQFYLVAKDRGFSDGEVREEVIKNIDWFAIDLNIEGGQRLEPQVFQGRFGIAEIELSFEVICTDNYSLPNCTSCDLGTSDLCTQRGTATTIHPPGPNDVTTADVRSDGTTTIGGVVGGLVGVVVIAVTVIVIVIIVKNKQEVPENDGSGETANDDIICHNNVVYSVNTAQPQTSTLTTGLPPSSQEHEYDYPLHDISEPLPIELVYERVDENDDELR